MVKTIFCYLVPNLSYKGGVSGSTQPEATISLMYNSSTILTTDVAMSNAISSTESIVATLSSNLITDFISVLIFISTAQLIMHAWTNELCYINSINCTQISLSIQAVLVLFIELSEMKTSTTSIQVHVYLLLLWLEVSHISISREDETCQVCCTANSMDDINLLEVHCNCKDWDNKTSCYNNQCDSCVNSIVEAKNCTAHVMYMNSNGYAYENITVPVEPCNLATTYTTNPYTKTKSTIVLTMIVQSTTAAIIVSPTTATILSTSATTESPTTSLTVILSTAIPTTAAIILLSIILTSR